MANQKDKVQGIFALISSTFKDNGDLDLVEFEKLAEYLTTKTGIHGIGLYGMVSEFHKLSDYEKKDLAELFISVAKKNKVTSLLSVTDHATYLAVKRAKEYQAMGADTLMLLPPHFLDPDVEEIKHHMISVLEAVDIPVLIQYAPQATGKYIEKEALIAMAEKYDNAVFKLEFKPALAKLKEYLDAKPDLVIITGYAGLEMIDIYDIGVKGVLPACSFTEIYVAIHNAYVAGDRKTAQELYDRLEPYLNIWMESQESLLAIEKEVLVQRGIIKSSWCRRPAFHLSEENHNEIARFLVEFKDILK